MVHARAQNVVISIACKVSNAVNVVHARAQKFCKFQGFCESLCIQELKVLQFPGFCDIQGFVQPGSIHCNFLGFCACRSSTCFTFRGCVHERAPNAARSASASRDFVHERVPHASICYSENCQIIGLQKTQNDNWICKKSPKAHCKYWPKITLDQLIAIRKPNLHQQLTSQLQFPGTLRDASITESKCFNCQGFKCAKFQKSCVHHWSTCRLYRFGFKNGHSGQILIQTWATPLVNTTCLFLQSIFRERRNIEYV